jgi:predicted aspartyl protease
MKRLAALLAATAASAGLAQTAPAPVAPEVNRFDPDLAQRWIAFDAARGNPMVIPVTVNGRPEQALLDTGSQLPVVVDRGEAAAMGQSPQALGAVSGVAGMATTEAIALNSFDISGLHHEGGQLALADLSAMAAAAPRTPITAIVGLPVLRGFALQIDFDNGRMQLLAGGGTGAAERPGAAVRLSADGHLLTSITVNGAVLDPVEIDTGSNDILNLSRDAWAAVPGKPTRASDMAAVALGGNGLVLNTVARLPELMIGGRALHDIEVQVEPADGYLARHGLKGRIGVELLRQFNVLLDPTGGRLALSERRTPAEPVRPQTVGIQGVYTAEGLQIVHVMAGSPAAAAGFHDGDRVCAIDGARPDASWNAQRGRSAWATAAPGTAMVMTPCGGQPRTIRAATFY